MSDLYGVSESNPLPDGYHEKITKKITGRVSWNDPALKTVIRLRLLGDPEFPALDVSYCHGVLRDGTPVDVQLPFSQLPKRGWKRALVNHAKKHGVYAAGLGIFANASVLI